VVIYGNYIHDNGTADGYERDIHGVGVGANVEYLWYVDNHSHDNAGDSIQVSYYGAAPLAVPGHIFIGRNRMHGDDENAVDLKACVDVVVSQNTIYDYYGASAGSDGTALVVHYDTGGAASRVWVVANEIYNCSAKATSVTGGSDEVYFIGNVIHDIGDPVAHGGIGFSSWSSLRLYVCGNTLWNVDTGLDYSSTAELAVVEVRNNIFGRLAAGSAGSHVVLGNTAYRDRAVFSDNAFYQGDGPVRIGWGATYDFDQFALVQPSKVVGSFEADPLFVNPANGDFRLQPGSPAVDAADVSVLQGYFDLFESLYGVSIAVDQAGQPRVVGAGLDMGALEGQNLHTPVAGDDAATTSEDEAVRTANVLANDSDDDGDALSITAFTQGAHGTVVYHDDGTFTYTPAADFHGDDQFAYTIDDGRGATATATVHVTITAVNDAPAAQAQCQLVEADGSLVLVLMGDDLESPYTDLVFNVPERASHGTLTLISHGRYQYTPDAGYFGPDTFTFTVTDSGDPAGTPGNAATSAPVEVALTVGRIVTFGGRTSAQVLDRAGNAVTVSLRGEGAGRLLLTGGDTLDIDAIMLEGTTDRSSLSISSRVRGGTVVVGGVTVTGALSGFYGYGVQLVGDFAATSTVSRITLGGITGPSQVSLNTSGGVIGARTALSLTAGQVVDCSLDTGGMAVSWLRAVYWMDVDGLADAIEAPSINSLYVSGQRGNARWGTVDVAGNFTPNLTLTGAPEVAGRWRLPTLGSVRIAGGTGDATWNITGDAGTVAIAGDTDGWTLDLHSSLRTLLLGSVANVTISVEGQIGTVTATRWDGGALSAASLQSLNVAGQRGNTRLGTVDVAGDFTADVTLSGVDNPTARWRILTLGSARIAGATGGAAWDITGDVGTIAIAGDTDGWTLDLHSSLGTLTLGSVANVSVSVDGQIGTVNATRWDGGTLEAASVQSLCVSGRTGNPRWGTVGVAGDFTAALTLSGVQDPAARWPVRTLGSARIAGGPGATTWSITGDVGAIAIAGNVDGWILDLHSSLGSLAMGDASNATVSVEGQLGAVTATRWVGGAISAAAVNSITIAGQRGNARWGTDDVAGDFSADLTLSGDLEAGSAWRLPTLNSVRVAGTLGASTWSIGGDVGSVYVGDAQAGLEATVQGDVRNLTSTGNLSGLWNAQGIGCVVVGDSLVDARFTLTREAGGGVMALGSLSVVNWMDRSRVAAAGDIGNVQAGAMRDSSVFAGVQHASDADGDAVLDLPDPDADLDVLAAASIASLSLRGISGEQYAFINSNVAAASLQRVSLCDPLGGNGGVAFGLAARSIASLSCATGPTRAAWPDLLACGDFQVAVANN
jgi:hypothetical protein